MQLKEQGVAIIRHSRNQGKGQALKTGFEAVLRNKSDQLIGVVTADADGQHAVGDIQHLCAALDQNPHALHLGTRQFT